MINNNEKLYIHDLYALVFIYTFINNNKFVLMIFMQLYLPMDSGSHLSMKKTRHDGVHVYRSMHTISVLGYPCTLKQMNMLPTRDNELLITFAVNYRQCKHISMGVIHTF